jgi:hypothetical protein
MDSIFGRHRVRATFYHTVSAIVVVCTAASFIGLIPMNVCFYITTIAFFADYLAEMYDPHPENMGSWFKAHFHRAFDDDGEE